MPIQDKASNILSKAKDGKELIKLMKARNDVDQHKIANIAAQFRSGDANYGRLKMTCLNLLRGAFSRAENGKTAKAKKPAKPKAAVKTEKKKGLKVSNKDAKKPMQTPKRPSKKERTEAGLPANDPAPKRVSRRG